MKHCNDWPREKKIEEMIIANHIFYSYIVNYLCLPGQIENWVYIVDCRDIGMGDIDKKVAKDILWYVGNIF